MPKYKDILRRVRDQEAQEGLAGQAGAQRLTDAADALDKALTPKERDKAADLAAVIGKSADIAVNVAYKEQARMKKQDEAKAARDTAMRKHAEAKRLKYEQLYDKQIEAMEKAQNKARARELAATQELLAKDILSQFGEDFKRQRIADPESAPKVDVKKLEERLKEIQDPIRQEQVRTRIRGMHREGVTDAFKATADAVDAADKFAQGYTANERLATFGRQLKLWSNKLKGLPHQDIDKAVKSKEINGFYQQLERDLANFDPEYREQALSKARTMLGKAALDAKLTRITQIKSRDSQVTKQIQEQFISTVVNRMEEDPAFSVQSALDLAAKTIGDSFSLLDPATQQEKLDKLVDKTLNVFADTAVRDGNMTRLAEVRDVAKFFQRGTIVHKINGRYKSAMKTGLAEIKKGITNPTGPQSLVDLIKRAATINNDKGISMAAAGKSIATLLVDKGASLDNIDRGKAIRLLKSTGLTQGEAESAFNKWEDMGKEYWHEMAETLGIDTTKMPADEKVKKGIQPVRKSNLLSIVSIVSDAAKTGNVQEIYAVLKRGSEGENADFGQVQMQVGEALWNTSKDSRDYVSNKAAVAMMSMPNIFSSDAMARLAAQGQGVQELVPAEAKKQYSSEFMEATAYMDAEFRERVHEVARLKAALRYKANEKAPSIFDPKGKNLFSTMLKEEMELVAQRRDLNKSGARFVPQAVYDNYNFDKKNNFDQAATLLGSQEQLANSTLFSPTSRVYIRDAAGIKYVRNKHGNFRMNIYSNENDFHVARAADGSFFEFSPGQLAEGVLPGRLYGSANATGDALAKYIDKNPDTELIDVNRIQAEDGTLNFLTDETADKARKYAKETDGMDQTMINTAIVQVLYDTRSKADFGLVLRDREVLRQAKVIAERNMNDGPQVIADIVLANSDKKDMIRKALEGARYGDLLAFYSEYYAEKPKGEDAYKLLMDKLNRNPTKGGRNSSLAYSAGLQYTDAKVLLGSGHAGRQGFDAGEVLSMSQAKWKGMGAKGFNMNATAMDLNQKVGQTTTWLNDLMEIFDGL